MTPTLWRFMFNGNAGAWKDIYEAARMARAVGYKLMAFNGDVYYVGLAELVPQRLHSLAEIGL